MRLATKTVSYGITHICVATGVAYALTGNLAVALGIGLIEPLVQTVVYAFHEKVWDRKLMAERRAKTGSSELALA